MTAEGLDPASCMAALGYGAPLAGEGRGSGHQATHHCVGPSVPPWRSKADCMARAAHGGLRGPGGHVVCVHLRPFIFFREWS